MNAPFLLAQATGATTGQAPTQTIKLTKPANGQAVTVEASNNGSVLIDFSAIANEKITLVHVGDKLVILFDNQSTLTIEPFYDSSNNPLANLIFEVAPGQDLTGAQFASTFPITDDQSVLPAAGGAAGAASGANFSDPTVDPFSVPSPLPLLGPTTLGNFVVTFDVTPNPTGVVPTTAPSLTGAVTSGAVDEGGLLSGTPGDLYGIGNDPGFATVVSGTVAGLVNFGTSGPSTITAPFQFVDTTAASNWVAGLHLTSHGAAVDAVTILINGNNTETLTASTSGPGAHDVFSLTLNENGQWTFTLINPLDHSDPGHSTPGAAVEDVISLDLSGLVLATAANGDSGTLANDFTVTVTDDVPVIASGTSAGTTDEGGLVQGTPGDLYGNGNDFGAATSATGSIAPLVKFGADGPDIVNGTQEGFQFVSATNAGTWLAGLALTSHGSAVDVATITVSGNVETLTASAADGHEVFTLALNEGTGQWTFTLINPFDDPNPGHSTPGAAVEDSVTLDLSGLVQAVDFDGDSVVLSSDFSVTVTDDIPVLMSNTVSGTVDEGALKFSLTTGDLYGFGNDLLNPHDHVVASGSLSGLVSFGADGPDMVGTTKEGFQFISATNAGTWLAGLGLTSHGSAVDVATVTVSGTTETLTASAADGHEVFTLSLNESTGAWKFTLINPLDDPNPGHSTPGAAVEDSVTINLSGLVQAVDFDGDSVTLSNDFSVTVVDDVPVLNPFTLPSFGLVAEGALASPPDLYGTGNGSIIINTVAHGSLAPLVLFGADGPDSVDPTSTNPSGGFEFVSTAAASTWLAGLGITSHGDAVNVASIVIAGGIETLTASTATDPHDVFTLALNEGTGAWTFTLLNPLDDAPDHGINSLTLNLSGLVQAIDYDGDSITLSNDFGVTVFDDIPVLTSNTVSGTVDEGALKFSLTTGDLYGFGNDLLNPHDHVVASGSLSGLVSFGADGPDMVGTTKEGFEFISATNAGTWLAGLGLTSHGSAVDVATVTVSGTTETLTASAADGHEVFTLSLNESTGAWKFTLINPLDDPNPGHSTPGAAVEDSVTINLSGLVQAVDFDGDSVTLSNDFSVTVVDDVPVLNPFTLPSFGLVAEGALASPPDLYGTGNGSIINAVASGSLAPLVLFGADGPDSVDPTSTNPSGGFEFVSTAAASTWLAGLGITSHGDAVNVASIVIAGGIETLTASTATDPHDVFTLALNEGTGAWTFTLLNPLDDAPDHGINSLTLNLSGLVQAIDYDGDSITLSNDFGVTVFDDIPVLTSNTVSGTVDEGALKFSLTTGDLYGFGNDLLNPHDHVVASGSLSGLVSFGADGPDMVGTTKEGFEFISATNAGTWLAGLGLTSHGSAVDVATVTVSGTTETLTASAADGHEVFTLSLNESTGAWKFTLINPLDDPNPGHSTPGAAVEDSVTINLSGLVQAVDFDGDSVTLSNDFSVTVVDDVPVLNPFTLPSFGLVAEGALASPPDLYGTGNGSIINAVASGSLAPLVLFGADGPDSVDPTSTNPSGGFEFVSTAAASTWLAGLGITSHGDAVNVASIVIAGGIETLTASTATDPHDVFTLALNEGTGAWTFTLLNPLDDAPDHGINSLTLNLSGLVQAIDYDGDSITLSNDFGVTVFDDVPVLTSNTVSATVDEGGLTSGTPGDLYGTGNDPGAATSATGSVSGFVSFGADGPNMVGGTAEGFQFVSQHDAGNWLAGLHLTSHGSSVNTATISVAGGVETLIASTSGAGAHEVFTLSLNESTGAWTFTLINPLDDPNPGHATPGPANEDSVTLNLSGLVQAVDFDGDSVTLSNDFHVTVTDDIPVATGNLIENGTFAAGNFSPESYGGADTDTTGGGGLDWMIGPSTIDPPSSFGANVQLERVNDGYLGEFTPDGHSMVDLEASPGNIEISQVVNGIVAGETYTIGFLAGGPEPSFAVPNTAELLVFWGGVEVADIHPGLSMQPYDVTVTGGANAAADTLEFEEVGVGGDLTGTYLADVVMLPGTPLGIVDEGGLTSGSVGDRFGTGNDPGAATVASGSLADLVSFGADGPDIINNQPAGFSLVSLTAATTWLAGLGVTSHGAAVDTVTIVGNTLTASTDPGQADPHTVFTLTVNGDGTWTFTLVNPLDDATPGHNTPGPSYEDSLPLDLSGLVQATDFDGDTISLVSGSFQVSVIDDVPVVTSNTASVTVDEGGLTSGTPGDLYGTGNDPGAATSATGSVSGFVSFGADGPNMVGGTAEGFQFVSQHDAGNWLAGLHLTSHGSSVNTATISVAGGVETLIASTSGAGAHEVFTLSLNESTGAWTFTLINPLDDPNPGHATPGPANEDSVTLNLSGLVQAVDFDGDSVTLSNDFHVTVTDDIPVATGNLIENGTFAAGNFSPESYGGADTDTTGGGGLDWMIGPSTIDPPSSFGANVQLERVNDGYLGEFTPDGHSMVDLEASPGNIEISQVVNGIVAGETYTIGFLAGGPEPSFAVPNTAELLVFWGGVEVADIHPGLSMQPYDVTVTGGANAAADTLEFEEVGVGGDLTGTYLADVVMLPGTPLGIVDEGGLTSGSVGDRFGTGNDPGAATVASGSLADLVSFGADGPDIINNQPAGFSLVSLTAATTWLAGLGVTSHGAAVDTVTIVGNTLTASTDPGQADPHTVFTLTVNGDGTWTFTLVNPLDDATPGHNTPGPSYEDSLPLDLSGLVQATDFDGDTISLVSGSFQVSVIDDVPVVVPNNGGPTQSSVGAVDEGGLVSGTPGDLYGTGNDTGAATVTSGSLATLVLFGADGPDSVSLASNSPSGGFELVSTATAGLWLAGLGITSHGDAINSASIAVVNGVETITASTSGAGAHEVFTLSLDEGSGAWTFTLINPIDQATGNGENTKTFDLSGLVQAVDFDGDTATLAHDFFVTVTDDVPVIVPNNGGPTQSSVGSVDEGGLVSGTPGDLYGTGNDPGSATLTSGSLATLVHFGADGPASVNLASTSPSGGFEFVSTAAAGTWLAGLGLTSHGDAINTASISVVNGIETLTAGTTVGAHEVFTLSLDEGSGAWTFTLINPIDQMTGHGENTSTFDLSGLVQAVDFDGDTAALAHDFFVTVTDDIPTANQVSATMAENANTTVTLVNGTDYSFGADGPAATGSVSFDTHDATIVGPAGETFGTPTYVINGSSIEIEPGIAFSALAFGQTATLDIPYSVTDFDGDTVTSKLVVTVDGPTVPPPVANDATIIENYGPGTHFLIPVVGLLANDSDPNATVNLISGATFSDSTHQFISFTSPTNSGVAGEQTFTYTITDANGTSGDATVTVERVTDSLSGHLTGGNDFLIDAGNDSLAINDTGTSNDVLVAGTSTSAQLNANSGNDVLVAGSNGSFALNGGSGNDTFVLDNPNTNAGSSLTADAGIGHTGHDTFEFLSPNPGGNQTVTISNFVSGQDSIAVSAAGFAGGLTAGEVGNATLFQSEAGNTFTSSAERFVFDTSNNGLYYSANGTGASEILLATVTNPVHAADIHVVA